MLNSSAVSHRLEITGSIEARMLLWLERGKVPGEGTKTSNTNVGVSSKPGRIRAESPKLERARPEVETAGDCGHSANLERIGQPL
jgi:hypothetical protein